jgi:uncharacterized membrane protein
VAVFVPTTPNPTTGLVVMMPRDRVVALDLDVESAIKMLVSLGVVLPRAWQGRAGVGPLAPAPPAA